MGWATFKGLPQDISQDVISGYELITSSFISLKHTGYERGGKIIAIVHVLNRTEDNSDEFQSIVFLCESLLP